MFNRSHDVAEHECHTAGDDVSTGAVAPAEPVKDLTVKDGRQPQ